MPPASEAAAPPEQATVASAELGIQASEPASPVLSVVPSADVAALRALQKFRAACTATDFLDSRVSVFTRPV